MKLWLQVLFAQGWLWRDRFPDALPQEPDTSKWSPSWWNLAFAVSLIALGGMWISYGDLTFGSLTLLSGVAYAVSSGDAFGLEKVAGTQAFWTSVSWGSGALTVAGFLVLLILSLAWQIWYVVDGSPSLGLAVVSIASASFMVFFGSMSLRAIECRYLFFADSKRNAHLLEDVEFSANELWLDPYWRLPKQILFPKKERHAH